MSALLALLHNEAAILVVVTRTDGRHYERKLSGRVLAWLFLATIEENTFLTAMAVHIDHQSNRVLSVYIDQVSLEMVDLRMQPRRCLAPLSVQVVARVAETVVSEDHTIGI